MQAINMINSLSEERGGGGEEGIQQSYILSGGGEGLVFNKSNIWLKIRNLEIFRKHISKNKLKKHYASLQASTSLRFDL